MNDTFSQPTGFQNEPGYQEFVDKYNAHFYSLLATKVPEIGKEEITSVKHLRNPFTVHAMNPYYVVQIQYEGSEDINIVKNLLNENCGINDLKNGLPGTSLFVVIGKELERFSTQVAREIKKNAIENTINESGLSEIQEQKIPQVPEVKIEIIQTDLNTRSVRWNEAILKHKDSAEDLKKIKEVVQLYIEKLKTFFQDKQIDYKIFFRENSDQQFLVAYIKYMKEIK